VTRLLPPALAPLRDRPSASGLFLDFDGTLSEIVARPELARPVPGATELLRRAAATFALVAICSGRPANVVRRLLGVEDADGVEVFGLYGLAADAPAASGAVRSDVTRAADGVPGSWVEDKGPSLAVHYRGAADEAAAERELTRALRAVAGRHGLELLAGKRVLEVAPAGTPGKGSAVTAAMRRRELAACGYAGDDVADLGAFAALDVLARQGCSTAKIAVRGPETPQGLLDAADVVVDGPGGLLELLRALVSP
jgi:trehalose 6-phosphate phosphatase